MASSIGFEDRTHTYQVMIYLVYIQEGCTAHAEHTPLRFLGVSTPSKTRLLGNTGVAGACVANNSSTGVIPGDAADEKIWRDPSRV